MTSEIQRIIDTIAAQLQRSAVLFDTDFQIQAFSPHFDPVDDIGLASIVHRKVDHRAVNWISQHGVAEARRAVRVPGDREIGLLPRVCAPVRCREVHLGYLWLVDADERLTDADLELVNKAADCAGVVFDREQLLTEWERTRERALLPKLLAADQNMREHSARELVDAGLFAANRPVVAFSLRPVLAGAKPDEALQAAVELALIQVRRDLLVHNTLHMSYHDRGVLLAAIQHTRNEREWLHHVGEQLHAAFDEAQAAVAARWRPLVGIGSRVKTLAAASVSLRQAYQATRVADVLHDGDIADWTELGIYKTLVELPQEHLAESMLHPGLVTLLSCEGSEILLETLEHFLELAGDVKATAEQLIIHRATLYYRLGRVEKVTGLNMRNGSDRLTVHLGLKMARLGGLYRHPKVGGSTPQVKSTPINGDARSRRPGYGHKPVSVTPSRR